MRKIKDIELKNPFILAPMAGITNSIFRSICHEFGASLVYSEMISDKGLLYDNKNTTKLLYFEDEEHPIAIQLFGSTADTIYKAAKIIEEIPFDILDINMGCPVKKVVNSGAGSALLKNLDEMEKILIALKKINKPITIKIRAGWDLNSLNYLDVIHLAEKNGVSAVAIHTRTRSQLYKGEASLEYIEDIRKHSDIFLIASGDVKNYEMAKAYLDKGCDAVMVARASLGNPWIFKELIAKYEGRTYIPPTDQEIIDVCLKHAKGLVKLNGEKSAMVEMRSHAVWYFKNLKNSKSYRLQLVNINTLADLEDICQAYLNEKTLKQ